MSELFKNLPDPTLPIVPVTVPVIKTEAEKLAEAAKPVVVTPAVIASANTPETQDEEVDEEDIPVPMDELSMLKTRAQMMGISYSNNIGIDALKNKINAKLNNEADTTDVDGIEVKKENKSENISSSISSVSEPEVTSERQISLREYMQSTQMKLVRLRITNLDPKKKDLPGEIITVANEYLGTVKKFVPFGEVTDGGYHVPECIYNALKERTFVSIKTRRGPRGQTIVENQDAREFSLEILPPLSVTELAQLAIAQQAKGGLNTD